MTAQFGIVGERHEQQQQEMKRCLPNQRQRNDHSLRRTQPGRDPSCDEHRR